MNRKSHRVDVVIERHEYQDETSGDTATGLAHYYTFRVIGRRAEQHFIPYVSSAEYPTRQEARKAARRVCRMSRWTPARWSSQTWRE